MADDPGKNPINTGIRRILNHRLEICSATLYPLRHRGIPKTVQFITAQTIDFRRKQLEHPLDAWHIAPWTPSNYENTMMMMMMMMIDVLRPLLCTWWAKWAEWPPKVMKRSQRWNTLQIGPHRDSNASVSDMWSKAQPVKPRRRPWEYELSVELSYCDLRPRKRKMGRVSGCWVSILLSLLLSMIYPSNGWVNHHSESSDV